MAIPKTNAMRILDKARIAYEIKTYEYEEDDLSGVGAAAKMGIDPAMMYKTLVLKGQHEAVIVCLLPVAEKLDLKKLARTAGEKNLEPYHVKDLLKTCGYMRGACSPIGMKKQFPTYADESLGRRDFVLISAGKRGCQLQLKAQDLIRFVGIRLDQLTQT